ncbi:MAG: hypothetical protein OEY37_01490 [Gammaproteobacteria bacterium]|nr:hypothetical protein [Gammaproteobacteria bacterium]MDH5619758.1 hypothetical protein [Gammaproteobacteria bacterium]
MHEEDNLEGLPDELVAELEKADKPGALITARVDRSIANLAREQFAARPERRRRVARAWYAVAATVVLAVLVLPFSNRLGTDDDALYADVDNSGQIDIADVLTLARRSNGKVSQAELDAFAMRVVALANSGDAS